MHRFIVTRGHKKNRFGFENYHYSRIRRYETDDQKRFPGGLFNFYCFQ